MDFTCSYCGHSGNDVTLHWDHATPAPQGGLTVVPACSSCNLQKGNKSPLQFARWLWQHPADMRCGHPHVDSNRLWFVQRTLALPVA